MEAAVDCQEKIAETAIEDDVQFAIAEAVYDVDHGIIVPILFVVGDCSEVLFDARVVGEGAEVDTAAGCSCCAKEVFMTNGKVEGAMTAHAQASDGAVGPVRDRGIMVIDIGDQFFYHKGLIT